MEHVAAVSELAALWWRNNNPTAAVVPGQAVAMFGQYMKEGMGQFPPNLVRGIGSSLPDIPIKNK